MATAQQTIEIVFNGIDNTGRSFSSVGSKIDSFASGVGNVTGPLADATDFVLKLDAAIVGLGAVMAGVAINKAGEFGDSMSEISTLIDIPRASMDAFSGDILDYSRDSTQSIDAINASVYNAISAGTDYADSLDLLRTAETLAVAGKADLNDATVLLASSMNAYGAETDEAASYSDALFTAVRLGQTTVPDLANSLSLVTGTAAAAKVPFSDLNAAVAALTASGLSTSQASTSMKAALSNIIKPTADATKASQELGVEFGTTALQAKGLDGLLGDLHEATGGNVDQMARFFGSTEALNAALILAADSSGTFNKALEEMEDRTGATAAAYEKMVANFAITNQAFKNNMEATFIAVGQRLIDQFTGDVSAATEILKSLGRSVDAGDFDPIFDVLNEVGADAEVLMRSIAGNLEEAMANIDWTGFEHSMGGLGEAFEGLFEGVDLSTPEGLGEALQGLVDVGSSLIDISAGIVQGMTPFIRGLADAVSRANDMDSSTKTLIGEVMGFGKTIDTLLPAVSGLGKGMQSIGTGITALAGASGFKSLISVMGTTTTNTRALAGAMGKGAGLLGVVVATGSQLYDLGGAVNGWMKATDEAEAAEDRYQKTLQKVEQEIGEVSDRTGIAMTTLEDFTQAKRDGLIVWDKTTEKWTDAETAARNQADALGELNGKLDQVDYDRIVNEATAYSDGMDRVNSLLADHGKQLGDNGEVIDLVAGKTREVTDAAEGFNRILDEDGNIVGYSDAVDGVGSAFAQMGDQANDAGKDIESVADKSKVSADKLAELEHDMDKAKLEASVDLNIAGFEAGADIAVAKAEAATEQIKSAFGSIDTSIDSTGDMLDGLFDRLGDDDLSVRDSMKVDRQISKENKNREKALKLQEKLTDAQVNLMKAQAERISKGESVLNIKAEGLQPHLESIWFEILEAIQVRANEEGAELLTGVCGQ